MARKERAVPSALLPARQVFEGLLDQVITRVSIEQWSVRVAFQTGELHIEGAWRLFGPEKQVVDQNQDLAARAQFDLWRIVGKRVVDIQFAEGPFPRFTMELPNHWMLEVLSDDDGLEDWNLWLGKSLVICDGPRVTFFPSPQDP